MGSGDLLSYAPSVCDVATNVKKTEKLERIYDKWTPIEIRILGNVTER